MGAAERRLRFRTSLLLIQEYGPTMTTDQVIARFLPNLTRRTVDNWVSRGDLPPRLNGVFDTQQIGDWWDDLCTAHAPAA